MKFAALKPIMWNDQIYLRPAGCPSTSGYSHDYGYGHEEWNGDSKWIWRGFRVFHKDAFLNHWNKQYRWIRWRCPPQEYHWFEHPIPLDPKRITGKEKLAMHHGRFT